MTEADTEPSPMMLARVSRQLFRRELTGMGLFDRPTSEDVNHLTETLGRVDEALQNSDQLGVRSGVVTVKGEPGTRVEVTIRNWLEEYRRALVDRIMSGTVRSALTGLEAAAEQLDVHGADAVRQEVAKLRLADDLVEDQRDRDDRDDVSDRIRIDTHRADMADRAVQRWLTRDTIAALIGAVMLIGLAGVIVFGMIRKIEVPEVLTNAFLLILGYFFGRGTQGTSKE